MEQYITCVMYGTILKILFFIWSFGHTKGWHLGFFPSCHSFVTIAHIRFSRMRLTFLCRGLLKVKGGLPMAFFYLALEVVDGGRLRLFKVRWRYRCLPRLGLPGSCVGGLGGWCGQNLICGLRHVLMYYLQDLNGGKMV